MKKFINKLFSMKVAMIILLLLIVACVFGSIIPQGNIESYYENYYSSTISSLILTLKLDDVFHAWWFIILSVFLCVSLLGCNILRFPSIYKRMNSLNSDNFIKDEIVLSTNNKPIELFKKLGFTKTQEKDDYIYANKNKLGLWGAWLTHLGILIIIIGFILGQLSTSKYEVYGLIGDTKDVEGTKLQLRINDFKTELRDDDTVIQYTSNVTLIDEDGNEESGEVSVNYPANLLGYKVYQNSTGWAARINFYEDDELLESAKVCVGEYMEVKSLPGLYILLRGFYPDYVNIDGQAYTKSSKLNNPGYLYMVYYNDALIGMNVLLDDYISLNGPNEENFKITISDPEQYTLLQLKKDNYNWVVLIGGIMLLAALIIAFYLPTSEMMAIKNNNKWDIYIRSKKGALLLKDKLRMLVKEEK